MVRFPRCTMAGWITSLAKMEKKSLVKHFTKITNQKSGAINNNKDKEQLYKTG